ncbi:MAG: hypothetical protein ABIY70_18490 [Capsulimonas sp.]|uniref:DUF6933 domain-containing protein n=1 Tax=Capsulimonas sp. TaxID=2494211 RepID=UPI0032633680
MMTLRCTKKLLKRMDMTPNDVAVALPSTTALGDWYANLLFTRPEQIVLCVNGKSRLCVLVPAKNANSIAERIQVGIVDILREIGISEDQINREKSQMYPLSYGATTGTPVTRSVIGTMTDYTKHLEYYLGLEEMTLDEIAKILSDIVCGPLNYATPINVAKELLAVD